MIGDGILVSIGTMVVCSALLLLLGERLRIPTIVLYICSGLFLGPGTGLLSLTHNIELISEVGILLLLFLVGLELRLDKIKNLGVTVLWAALIQMACTALPAAGVCLLFDLSPLTSVFIGVAVMFSSTVMVVKQLAQVGETNKTYGKLSVGVLLVQDLAVILLLTVVAALGGDRALSPGELLRGLGGAALGMAVVVLTAIAAGRWLLPVLFRWAATDQEAAFLWSLAWCFGLVALAEFYHLSPEIGAFLAGMALAQLPYAHHFRRRIHPLTNFFVALFFITLGARMKLGEAFEFGALPALLVILVFSLKFTVFRLVLPRLGQDRRTAILTGVSLCQISEFSLIFGALGVSAGLVDEAVLSLLSLIALVTMSVSSFLFSFRKDIAGPEAEVETDGTGLSGHVVLIGVNSLTRALIKSLKASGFQVVVLDRDAGKLEGLGVAGVVGDADHPEALEEAHFRRAAAVIATMHVESTNELVVYRCKEAGVPCAVHAFASSVIASLERLEADFLIRSRILSTQAMEEELRASGVLQS